MKKVSIKTIGKIGGVALLIFFIGILITPLPSPLFDTPYSTTLYASDGTLLSAAIASDRQWRFPLSDSIPEKFEVAIRLFEDEYFYYHPGINPLSIFRAYRQNLDAGKVISGGSTLTMQTVRMGLGNQPRTYAQKFVEIFSSLKLEIFNRKSTILKLYADHAPFGGNIVGISAASRRYFGRPPHQLSWAEAATLAILPNNPGSIFPGKNQHVFLEKRNGLLEKIHERGFIDDDELFLAKEESLPSIIKPLPNDADHLLHRSINEGRSEVDLHSTLDTRLQREATRKVNEYSRKMSFNQIMNAAAVIIEIENGNTLAYVGNTNNPGDHGQYVDIIMAKRSPGSLLKPFLYAAALDEGLILPKQLLPDIPIFYNGFAPKNFDKKYRGAVPADDALISSLNVPYVHLLKEYGYEKFHQKLQQIGFRSFDRPAGHYGLSLILGGGETTLWELTSVYASMARALSHYDDRPLDHGYAKQDYHSNRFIQRDHLEQDEQLDADGHFRAPSIQFALEAMQKVKRPEEEAGWNYFGSKQNIAWKTGTSFGFRDGWAIGLSREHLVGVWIGNADGEGRPGLTGVNAAAPLLFDLFERVESNGRSDEPFGMPQSICRQSGMLASSICDQIIEMQLPEYMMESSQCTFHQTAHLNDRGSHQVNSSCYEVSMINNQPWFVLPPVQAWYYRKYHTTYKPLPPFLSGCEQTETNKRFDLIYPNQFTRVYIPIEQGGQAGQTIFEAAHENRKAIVYWHLDDQYLGSTQSSHQMGIQADKGMHTLTLIDDSGNEVIQNFEVIN